jgi:pimeloyl-ACP methyl ester carboxylesterase
VPLARTPAAYGLAFEPVQFASRDDGTALRGWLIPPPAGVTPQRAVVSVHGKGANRENGPGNGSLEISASLARQGHPVLAFDLRGSGESGGRQVTLGARESGDVRGAIDFLEGRRLAARGVDLLGYSMGAATSLLAAAADSRVHAVAEDSGYADLGEVLAKQVPKASHLPRAFTPGTLLMARLLLGVDALAIRPIDGLPALTRRGVPLLIIHGEADDVIPLRHGRRLAAAYGPGAQTLFVPHAGHVRAYLADPDTYLDRLISFFARADEPLGTRDGARLVDEDRQPW